MTINLKKEGSPAKVQNSFDVRKYFHIFVQSHAVICRDMTGGVWDIDIHFLHSERMEQDPDRLVVLP